MFAVVKIKTIVKTVAAQLLAAVLISLTGVVGSYEVYAGKTIRKLPIYCVDREDGAVALSFDASWGCDGTEKILAELERYDAVANYFVVSLWVDKYPDLLKKLHDSGRVEVGMHSATHPHMKRLSATEIEREISLNSAAIEKVTGQKPTLFRAPFGEYSDAVIEVAERQGAKVIQWDVDSLDWKNLSASQIAARVLGGVKSGSIVLMHNDGKHTPEALPLILEGLKNKNLKTVKISELIYEKDYEIDHTGKQIPIQRKE